MATKTARSETELEELARTLLDLRQRGMRPEEIEVIYAQHVLGYSISELATVTGHDRRSLYVRRDRGHRRLCACTRTRPSDSTSAIDGGIAGGVERALQRLRHRLHARSPASLDQDGVPGVQPFQPVDQFGHIRYRVVPVGVGLVADERDPERLGDRAD